MTTGIATEADAVSRISESIKNADIPTSEQVSEPAPTEAKPAETQTAADGKDGQTAVNDGVKKSDDTTPKQDEAKADEKPVEEEKQEVKESPKVDPTKNPFGLSEDELSDMLGLPKPEEETAESLRVKYANSSREAHRLVELEKARQEFFKSQGLKLVQDEEGKFVLVPDEGYEEKLDLSKDLNIKKIYDNLSEEDKESLITEPEVALSKIGKKIAMELLAKRPPVSARRVETRISDAQADQVWQGFVAAKLQDGKTPRYQDADNPAVVEVMTKMLSVESPAMDKFKKVINSDPDLHYIGLEHLYLKARNAMLEGRLRQALAQNQKQEKKKELVNKVAVSAGSQIPTQAQTEVASTDVATRIAQAIRDA